MTPLDLKKEILAFANLSDSWSFGEGDTISKCVIQKAVEALDIFHTTQLEAQAFPNLNGTITLSFTHGALNST